MDLSERVGRLERANRNWRLAAGGLAVAAMLAAAPRPKVPAVLKANNFHVVDAAGNVRVAIGTDGRGASITLFEAPAFTGQAVGQSRAIVAINGDNLMATASFYDREGKVRRMFGVAGDGAPIDVRGDGKVEEFRGEK